MPISDEEKELFNNTVYGMYDNLAIVEGEFDGKRAIFVVAVDDEVGGPGDVAVSPLYMMLDHTDHELIKRCTLHGKKADPHPNTMTDDELAELIRDIAAKTDSGGPWSKTLDEGCERLKRVGITAHMNEGPKATESRRATMEWFAGSYVAMVEEKQLIGMLEWINCVDKFTA